MAKRATKTVSKTMLPVAKPRLVVDNTGMKQVMDAIIAAAANPRFSVDKMERLIAMKRDMEDREAKIAFDNNLAAMQIEMPQISKDNRIIVRKKDPKTGERTGPIEQSTGYASWESIDDIIRPILHRFLFGLSFRTGTAADGRIIVTAILSRSGHREETTTTLPYDSTGSKNAVQSIGSSLSYGKRYTASLLLNIVTRGEDDDGMSFKEAKLPVSQEQLAELLKLVEESGADPARFCALLRVQSIPDIPALRFEEAKHQLLRKIAKKAKEEKAKREKGDFPGDRPL